VSRIRKQKKNTNIKKTLITGVIAGTSIAVPAITIAAGVGKIDPNQIDYSNQFSVGQTVEIYGTDKPWETGYGGESSNWSCIDIDYFTLDVTSSNVSNDTFVTSCTEGVSTISFQYSYKKGGLISCSIQFRCVAGLFTAGSSISDKYVDALTYSSYFENTIINLLPCNIPYENPLYFKSVNGYRFAFGGVPTQNYGSAYTCKFYGTSFTSIKTSNLPMSEHYNTWKKIS